NEGISTDARAFGRPKGKAYSRRKRADSLPSAASMGGQGQRFLGAGHAGLLAGLDDELRRQDFEYLAQDAARFHGGLRPAAQRRPMGTLAESGVAGGGARPGLFARAPRKW